MSIVPSGRGYADALFASSYRGFGQPVTLRHSRGTVLLLEEPRTGRTEAVGPYPLLSCADPERIVDDLAQLCDLGAVTFTAVLDPLRATPRPDPRLEIMRPYKTHFLTILAGNDVHSARAIPSEHHRREVARAREDVTVHVELGADADVDDWMRLWALQVERFALSGMAGASSATVAAQFALDGALVMWASVGGQPVAAQLVLVASEVAYVHLAVSNPAGRRMRARYALDATLLELLVGSGRTIHWGGVPGRTDLGSGLWRYKAGWANAVSRAYLVGAVLDPDAFLSLGGRLPVDASEWFPPYRQPSLTQGLEREPRRVA